MNSLYFFFNTVPSVLERDPLKLPYTDTARPALQALDSTETSNDSTATATATAAEKELEKKTPEGRQTLSSASCPTVSCILSHPISSCHITSHPISSYIILPHHILSYLILSHLMLSCPILSHHISSVMFECNKIAY